MQCSTEHFLDYRTEGYYAWMVLLFFVSPCVWLSGCALWGCFYCMLRNCLWRSKTFRRRVRVVRRPRTNNNNKNDPLDISELRLSGSVGAQDNEAFEQTFRHRLNCWFIIMSVVSVVLGVVYIGVAWGDYGSNHYQKTLCTIDDAAVAGGDDPQIAHYEKNGHAYRILLNVSLVVDGEEYDAQRTDALLDGDYLHSVLNSDVECLRNQTYACWAQLADGGDERVDIYPYDENQQNLDRAAVVTVPAILLAVVVLLLFGVYKLCVHCKARRPLYA